MVGYLIDYHDSIGIEKAAWQTGKGTDPLLQWEIVWIQLPLITGESYCWKFKLEEMSISHWLKFLRKKSSLWCKNIFSIIKKKGKEDTSHPTKKKPK